MGRIHKSARVLAPVVALITSSMFASAQQAPTTQPIGQIPPNQVGLVMSGPATTQGAKEIMLNFKEGTALFAMVNDRIERISFSALRVDALKPGSI